MTRQAFVAYRIEENDESDYRQSLGVYTTYRLAREAVMADIREQKGPRYYLFTMCWEIEEVTVDERGCNAVWHFQPAKKKPRKPELRPDWILIDAAETNGLPVWYRQNRFRGGGEE